MKKLNFYSLLPVFMCLMLSTYMTNAQTADDITLNPPSTELRAGESITISAEVTGFGDNPIFSWVFEPSIDGITLSNENTAIVTITAREGLILGSPSLPLFLTVKSDPNANAVTKGISSAIRFINVDVPTLEGEIPNQVLILSEGPQTLNIAEYFRIPASSLDGEHLISVAADGVVTANVNTIVSADDISITLTPISLGSSLIFTLFRSRPAPDIADNFIVTVVNDGPVLDFTDDRAAVATIDVAENKKTVATLVAANQLHSDDPTVVSITYALTGGADMELFTIDENTGILEFNSPPDYENPASASTSNTYKIRVSASSYSRDDVVATVLQEISVTVTDVVSAALTPVTTAVSEITSTTATLNGGITSGGGETITAIGFVYSTSSTDLTTANTAGTVAVSGTEIGVVSKNITDLMGNTQYHYRVYAVNSSGMKFMVIYSVSPLLQ